MNRETLIILAFKRQDGAHEPECRHVRKVTNDTLVGHSCGTLLWVILEGNSCGTLLRDTLVGHSCGTVFWDTLVGHSCGTL